MLDTTRPAGVGGDGGEPRHRGDAHVGDHLQPVLAVDARWRHTTQQAQAARAGLGHESDDERGNQQDRDRRAVREFA